jgi:PAS domain S-box-containing protein
MTITKALYDRFLDIALKNKQLYLWRWDREKNQLEFNLEARDFFEGESWTLEEAQNVIVGAEFKQQFMDDFTRALENGVLLPREYELKLRSGKRLWVCINGETEKDDSRKVIGVSGTIQDITDLKTQYTQTVNNQMLLERLMDIVKVPIFYKDRGYRYQYCNKAFSDFLGYSKEQVVGKTVYEVVGKYAEMFHEKDMELFRSGGDQEYETFMVYADGSEREIQFNKSVYVDDYGEKMGIIGAMHDATEENRQVRESRKREAIKELFLEISHIISEDQNELKLFDKLTEGLVAIVDDADYGSILEIIGNETLYSISNYGYNSAAFDAFEIPLKDSYIYKLSDCDL